MTELLEQEVWKKAIIELRNDLKRCCPTLPGGQKNKETVEQYARRGINRIEYAIGRLNEAKQHYREVGGNDDSA